MIAKGRFTHSMPRPCPSHAFPLPCRALIHTCHAAPLPCSDNAVSFVNVRMVAGNIRTSIPTKSFCSVLLPLFSSSMQMVFGFTLAICIWDWYASDNNFVELRVVAGRSRQRASSPQASLDGSAVPWPWEEWHSRGWHGRGMASVNQTRPHSVNQIGKTHSKPLAAGHDRGTAWARHAMCESALQRTPEVDSTSARLPV